MGWPTLPESAVVEKVGSEVVVSDPARVDELLWARMRDGWVIVSGVDGADPGAGCERCEAGAGCTAGGVTRIVVALGGGGDQFDGGASLADGTTVPISLDGASGKDAVCGGRCHARRSR